MLTEFQAVSSKIELEMNVGKANLSPEKVDVSIDGISIENVTELKYLGHLIILGIKMGQRIRITWAAIGIMGDILRDPNITINLK